MSDEPTSDESTSDAPPSDAPTSDEPPSDAPTNDAPGDGASAPSWSAAAPSLDPQPPVAPAGARPELLVAGAFAGGLMAAMILKRLGR